MFVIDIETKFGKKKHRILNIQVIALEACHDDAFFSFME
jgi:hypothetical protein